jgi:hypothetical protein
MLMTITYGKVERTAMIPTDFPTVDKFPVVPAP